MNIPFTQFLMPDGRERSVEIDRPEPIAALAKQLFNHGCKFEIEILSNGYVSMDVILDGVAIAAEVCLNGPSVPENVDKMIQNAANDFAERKCQPDSPT